MAAGQKTGWVPEDVASVAVIGGSGLYSLFDPTRRHRTRSRPPTALVELTPRATSAGGRRRSCPGTARPLGARRTASPYRANIWALASLGVRAIISTAAVGAVDPAYPVGSLCLPDQYLDRTNGRADTFYDEDSVQHLPSADPFCPQLHGIAIVGRGRRVVTPAARSPSSRVRGSRPAPSRVAARGGRAPGEHDALPRGAARRRTRTSARSPSPSSPTTTRRPSTTSR